MSLGNVVHVGGVVSATVTDPLTVELLPAASVAAHEIGVLPSAKTLPDKGAQTTAGADTASVAAGRG